MINKDVNQKKSSRITAYKLILDQILNSKLKSGEIVTEISLSGQLGISRTPVREALRKLENEGLIITDNRIKKIYYLSARDIENIFDIKISIESLIAGLAATYGTTEQMNELSNTLIHIQELVNERTNGKKDEDSFFAEWFETDKKFHQLLFQMAGNQRAEQIISILNVQWHRIKMSLWAIEGRVEKAAEEHGLIGKAVISRNKKEAEEAVRLHLNNLKSVLIRLMSAFNY